MGVTIFRDIFVLITSTALSIEVVERKFLKGSFESFSYSLQSYFIFNKCTYLLKNENGSKWFYFIIFFSELNENDFQILP